MNGGNTLNLHDNGTTRNIDGVEYQIVQYHQGIKINPQDLEIVVISEEELQHPIHVRGKADTNIGAILRMLCGMFAYEKDQIIAHTLISKNIMILPDDRVVIVFRQTEYYPLYYFYEDVKDYYNSLVIKKKLSISILRTFLAGNGSLLKSQSSSPASI